MNTTAYNSPIVVFGFNRPHNLRRLLHALNVVNDRQIYFYLDYPRQNNSVDTVNCAEVQSLVSAYEPGSNCVKVILRPFNFGCRRNIEEGLDEIFQLHDRAIILEDDCIPAPAFFSFCDLMLEQYSCDAHTGMITGGNFCTNQSSGFDYYKTSYPLIWGWATWRRVWQTHDKTMASFNYTNLKRAVGGRLDFKELLYWRHYFTEVKQKRIDTWDYQLTWTFFEKKYTTIFPKFNLVENIGFGSDATHTFYDTRNQAIAAVDWQFTGDYLRGRTELEFDVEIFRRRFGGLNFWYLLKQELKRFL